MDRNKLVSAASLLKNQTHKTRGEKNPTLQSSICIQRVVLRSAAKGQRQKREGRRLTAGTGAGAGKWGCSGGAAACPRASSSSSPGCSWERQKLARPARAGEAPARGRAAANPTVHQLLQGGFILLSYFVIFNLNPHHKLSQANTLWKPLRAGKT